MNSEFGIRNSELIELEASVVGRKPLFFEFGMQNDLIFWVLSLTATSFCVRTIPPTFAKKFQYKVTIFYCNSQSFVVKYQYEVILNISDGMSGVFWDFS